MNSSTDEEENFFRLYKLVVGIGTKALREKFDQIFPPSSLYSTLKTSETMLRRKLRIRPDQDALLFPSSGMPSSNAFDLTLMISLIRNLAPPCPTPKNGYDELPSPTEISVAADLARMKWYRNSFSHVGKPEIDTSQYTNDWQVLSETITRIGGPTYKVQCDTLKNSHLTLDELNCLREELVKTNRSIEQMCTLFDAVVDKHRRLEDKQGRLEADTAELIKEELRESTFVETKASKCALEILKNNGVVLLTGGAGTGKSRMARMVLHHFLVSNSEYRAVKLNTIDEWQTLDKLDEEQKLIVLLDNIFGETNCTFNKGNNEQILDLIYAHVQKGNVKVVITIRNTVKQHCTEIFESHRLFSFDLINLNAPEYKLSSKEKVEMLVRHFSRKREGVQLKEGNLIDNNGIILNQIQLDEIIYSDPVYGFPLTVYRFVNNKKFRDLKSKFFTSPTDIIIKEINKLRKTGKDDDNSRLHYAVLVYTALNGNSINRNDKTLVNEINSIIETVYDKKISYKKWNVLEAIEDMLKQMYLIKDPNHPCCHFSHITLQESVILSFVDVDESSMNKIIPILSLSFIVKIARSEIYKEKEGEVVLKVPQICYPLLAERVAKLVLADGNDHLIHRNFECFLRSELFDSVGDELLVLMVESYLRANIRSDDIFTSKKMDDGDMDNGDIFNVCLPVLLLRHAAMMKEKISTVVLSLIRKVINESMQSYSYCKINHDCKAAIVDVVYKVCSTGDVKTFTDALHIAEQINIHVSEDQFLHMFEMNESTIYIYQCIVESFLSFNLPMMLHFSEKLKDEAFDVNLFLKRIYADPKKRISLDSIVFLRKFVTFDDNVIEWMIKQACKRHLLPEVKYLFASKDRTNTDTVYITCFLKCKYCDKNGNSAEECRSLFKFLLSQFDHNMERIDRILNLMHESEMHCGGLLQDLLAVVDRRLLNFNTILSLACDTADVEAVKWVFDNIGKEHLDIKQAFMRAVTNVKYTHRYWKFGNDDPNSRLDVVKCLLTALNITEFNFEDVLNSVWACKYFKIIQYFLENVKYDKVDTSKIVANAVARDEFDFLVWILQNGVKINLDFNIALWALFTSCTMFQFDKLKTLIQKFWPQLEKIKTIVDQRKIVDEACKNDVSSEMLIWFLEVFDHKLLDINNMLTISYRRGDLKVVKYIVENVDHNLYVIDMNLFKNHCSLPIRLQINEHIDKSEMDKFLLSKSGFTVESLQTLMNESIRSKHWNLVDALLIHCENVALIFDIETIVQAFVQSGEFDLLNRMLANEKTKHCIQFIDIDMVMTETCYEKPDPNLEFGLGTLFSIHYYNKSKNLHRLLTQIWTIRKERCDINSIIKKHCSDKGLNADVLKWILDNVDHDCIYLDIILQSCCRNVQTSFVKYMFSKVEKEKLDVKSAFLEACRSNAENHRPSKVIRRPFPTYTYNPSIVLIDFLIQQCGADMLNISEGVNIALSQANYKLIYYFLANGLCKDMIDMKSLLNSSCHYGEYDLAVWILQNIQHTDLDLSSAFINTCMYQRIPIDKKSTIFVEYRVNDNSVRHKPYYDKRNIGNYVEHPQDLWCAMYMLDKIDDIHSLDYETAISIARKNENERMVQWLQNIFKSSNKDLQHRKPDRKLGALTDNTQDINISSTNTDINSPAKCEDATALSINLTSDQSQQIIACSVTSTEVIAIGHSSQMFASSVPSSEMITDNNEHLEPSERNTISNASSKQKRTLDNDTTSDEEKSSDTLKKCKNQ